MALKYMITKNPNKLRFFYDLAALVFSAVLTIVLVNLFGVWESICTAQLIAYLLITLAILFGSGLYTRYRISGFRKKSLLILGSCTFGSISVSILTQEYQISLAMSLLAIPLLLVPRFILQTTSTVVGTLSKKVVKEKGGVLVIGGAGYIGTYVVQVLLESGKKVRVLDKLMFGEEPLKEFSNNENFELIRGDCTNIGILAKAIDGCSEVVHLAGLVGDPACAVDKVYTKHTNIIATRMVRDLSIALGVNRLIFASSCSVYGISDKEVDEEGELNPVSLYAETKVDSERELLTNIPDDLSVTVLRFATVFGHSRRPRFDLVANIFSAQSIVDGTITVIGPDQWRPFVHVFDLARAIKITLEAPVGVVNGQIFNVGDRRLNYTIGMLGESIQKIANKYGFQPKMNVDDGNSADKRNYAVCFEKIKKKLGFESTILLEDGVDEMICNLLNGIYGDYTNDVYSNYKTTKKLKDMFYSEIDSDIIYSSAKVF